MSRLSATILLSSSLFAATNLQVESFLQKSIGKNPNVSNLTIKVIDKQAVKDLKGWDAFTVKLSATVKQGTQKRPISQSMIYFANGDMITPELTNMKTGKSVKDSIAPKFKTEFYTSENLIYGNADAKHKVAIFSDPLCPFCRKFVPKAINYMKKYPEIFAVYYYHLPLERMHPASVALTRAALVAEHNGRKNIVLDMYTVEIDAHEKDEQKILDAFNKKLNTNISIKDIHSKKVNKQVEFDKNVVSAMMVSGTPTIYFDGKKDQSKNRYKQVKVK